MTARALEAENAVLGAVLLDARCLAEAARTVRPQDFSLALNQELFRVILRMDRACQRIDPVTVLEESARAGVQVSDHYLLELMDLASTAVNVEAHAGIVRERAQERGAAAVAGYITEALNSHTPAPEVLMGAARQIEALQKEGVNEDLLDPDGAMLAFYEHRDLVNRGGDAAYVRTGYQDLDRQLGGGMLNSGMYILAARPGMGKTTLAINIVDRLAQKGRPVLFVSLEMDPEQIEAKRLARETGIPANRLLMDKLTEEEESAVAHAADVIRALPVHLNKRDTVTVAQVEMMARRVKGLGLIVIDYIGKILPDAQGRKANRVEYMTEISGEIKNLARRFQVPVLTLCQLNRALAGRSDQRPILSDLRDTGAIEQDADGVIFLHRTDYYQPRSGGAAADLQVIVAKNRHGSTGECGLAFDLATSKMTTSRSGPIPRPKRPEPKPKQMTWEELEDKWSREQLPYKDKEATS